MNYGELRARFKAIMKRKDFDQPTVDFYLQHGLNRLARLIRVPSMERFVTLPVNAYGYVAVPTNYLQLKAIYVGEVRLERLPDLLRNRPMFGPAKWFSRIADRFYIHPGLAPGDTIQMAYYADFNEMSLDADSDAIITIAPDAVLAAACAWAAKVFEDDRYMAFEDLFQSTVAEIKQAAEEVEMREGPITIYPATDEQDY